MLIEPNCSIIAACLPCYGPLFAKGRSPESLVRSVRSVFSLRSKNSSTNRSPSGSTNATARNETSFDSHVELKQVSKDWSESQNQGCNTNKIETKREEFESYENGGISVTKGFDIDKV